MCKFPVRQKEETKEKNTDMISRQKHGFSQSVGQINQFEKALKSANKISCCCFVERQKMFKKLNMPEKRKQEAKKIVVY